MARIVRHTLHHHRDVLTDHNLTIEAKCLFMYLNKFLSLYGLLNREYEQVFKELNISSRRYYFYRRELIEKGYLVIKNN